MNQDINTTTSLHIVAGQPRGNSERASDLSEIRFGTLRIRPIAVVAATKSSLEDPESYALAEKVFEHLHASLILFAKTMETELGIAWKIMVEDGD